MGPWKRTKNAARLGGIFETQQKISALGELGSATSGFQAALLSPPKGQALWGPRWGLDLLGGSEFRLRQGGLRPLARATWRAPSEMGPQERKKKNAARLGGIFEAQQ